jgi:microcystin-dependent protein
MLQRGNRIVAQDVITRIDEALSALDTGAICLFAGMSTPTGFLDCYGGEVSRITYGDLFAVIGTTWGAGNGSTTFTLPNFMDRYPIGYGSNGVGYLTGQTLPNITASVKMRLNAGSTTIPIADATGAFYITQDSTSTSESRNWDPDALCGILNFQASRSNGIYGASAGSLGTGRVIPYSSTVRFLIKY